MTRPSAALQREWAAKLRASGFHDLEGADRDGLLSDRGVPGGVRPEASEEARAALEERGRYIDWARDVLRHHRFAGAAEREIWEQHAAGASLKEIGRRLGPGGYHAARDTVAKVKRDVRQVRQQARGECRRSGRQMRALIRRTDPAVLAQLARLLLRGLAG